MNHNGIEPELIPSRSILAANAISKCIFDGEAVGVCRYALLDFEELVVGISSTL